MTEKAKASGNALDRPTSVGSEMAREPVEPLPSGKQMTTDARRLMRPEAVAQRSTAQSGCRSVSPSGSTSRYRVPSRGPANYMTVLMKT